MQNKHVYVSQKEMLMPSGTVLITKLTMYGEIMRYMSCLNC
jgi:hypothetical protein